MNGLVDQAVLVPQSNDVTVVRIRSRRKGRSVEMPMKNRQILFTVSHRWSRTVNTRPLRMTAKTAVNTYGVSGRVPRPNGPEVVTGIDKCFTELYRRLNGVILLCKMMMMIESFFIRFNRLPGSFLKTGKFIDSKSD